MMNANLFGYSLRSSALSALFWTGGIALFGLMIVALADALGALDFVAMLEGMPPAMRQALLGGAGDLSQLAGLQYLSYMVVEYFSFWLLIMMGLYPLFTMGGTLAREADKGTLGILLAQPVARWKVCLSKYVPFAIWSTVIVVGAAIGLVLSEVVVGIDTPLDRSALAYVFVNLWLFMLAIGALALAFSAFFLSSGAAWGAMGLLFFAGFVLNALGGFEGPVANLKYLSIFHYWQPADILLDPHLALQPVLVYSGLAVAGLVAALAIFHRREFQG